MARYGAVSLENETYAVCQTDGKQNVYHLSSFMCLKEMKRGGIGGWQIPAVRRSACCAKSNTEMKTKRSSRNVFFLLDAEHVKIVSKASLVCPCPQK